MQSNTILAIIIVLIFLMAFLGWVLVSLVALMEDAGLAFNIIVPGLIVFGFWGLVASRLYNCPSRSVTEDLGLSTPSEASVAK